MFLDTTSLVNTIDNVNEKLLYGEQIPPQEGLETARWIISRQGQKGSYRGMPAPTAYDFTHGIRVFTGEKLAYASARHILGQEASRAAWLLGKNDPVVREAYQRATGWMLETPDFQHTGTFCCGKCSLAFWRHYWVGEHPNKQEYLQKGLQWMRTIRLGDGKWRTLPFYYAIYTLLGLDLDPARTELAYARPAMERYLRRAHEGEFSSRRFNIISRALQTIQ
jgi:hypothetical protein